MKQSTQTQRPGLALEAILSIKSMPRRLSDRFDALEMQRDEALPKRGHIKH